MNLKKTMFDKIERNSIKVNVNGDVVYLKKSRVGWHVIYPPIDINSIEEATDEKGEINWKKVKWDRFALFFGSKSNAIWTTIIGLVVLLFTFGVWQVITSYNTIVTNPIVQGCIKQAGIVLG